MARHYADIEPPDNALPVQQKKWPFSLPTNIDMPFFILVMILLVIGLVSLFSASFAYAYYWNDGDSYYYIKRQLIYAVAGLVALFSAASFNYRLLKMLSWPVFVISGILLVIVLFLPEIQNVHRWIRIGTFQFQPSEIAKLAVVLVFAAMIDKYGEEMKTFKKGYLKFISILAIVCGLVILGRHLSGTMLILMIGLTMMFIGGTRLKWILATIAAGGAGAFVMIFLLGYEKDRIAVWLDPFGVYASNQLMENGQSGKDAAWQTVQSLYAIGSGGLAGEGLGNSRQKHLFLPEPQNDFIFSIVCEEMGFIGAVIIIVLFALLVWRGFYIGMHAADRFGSLVAIGLSTQVGFQVALNLGVITNALPNTGISLPFFSYGGSALIMLLGQMGIILSISRRMQKPAKREKKKKAVKA